MFQLPVPIDNFDYDSRFNLGSNFSYGSESISRSNRNLLSTFFFKTQTKLQIVVPVPCLVLIWERKSTFSLRSILSWILSSLFYSDFDLKSSKNSEF